MVLLKDWSSRLALDDPEERRVLSQVSWAQYEVLLTELGEESPYHTKKGNGLKPIALLDRGEPQPYIELPPEASFVF